MAAVSSQQYYLRPIRAEDAARHTHAANVLFMKHRRKQAEKRSNAPGEDGTPQSISERVFDLALGMIAVAVLVICSYWAIQAYLALRGAQ